MIIGSNNVVEQTLMRAAKSDKDKERASFSVIVVDTCPSFSGRDVAQRLSHNGIHCKYTLIQGISALITQTTKVFLGVSYVLGNGGVVSDIGTSMVAYLASQHRVPVIAFCETYKFTQRVNLDQIKKNEVGDPKEITHNHLLPQAWSEQERDALLKQRNLQIRNLKHDFTGVECVTVILCELGKVSPVSVSVVVDEFNAENQFAA